MFTSNEINEYLIIMKNFQLKEEKKLPINVYIKTRKSLLLINVAKSNYVMIVE